MKNTTPITKGIIVLITLLVGIQVYALNEQTKRPFIWVKQTERTSILEKIEQQEWAKLTYADLIEGLDDEIAAHNANPSKYLRNMPFDWENAKQGETPPFTYTVHKAHNFEGIRRNLDNATDEEMANARKLMQYLGIARDSGIAYFLKGDNRYAQLAADILSAAIQGIIQLEPSDWRPRGGWLFPDDILLESRRIGQELPIIYDFIAPFLARGGKPYDIGKESRIEFPLAQAQQVFRTYADLVMANGMIDSNHPVLESACLVYNALALEDASERNKYVSYYLKKDTDHQDSLSKVAKHYEKEGDIWPETSQYLNHVAVLSTRLMWVLSRYDPSLGLGTTYQNILLALPVLESLVYPNGEIIRWGDGHRRQSVPYDACEEAYLLGRLEGIEKVTSKLGPILNSAISSGAYERKGILALFWLGDDFSQYESDASLPRTDHIPHAGIFLQRNFSATGNPSDGLMAFVGGAHMVHGHAEGMNIELYGKGQVLGVDNGRGRYAVDLHENYSRLFAAHNTVIVNGSSRSDGGWVDLGINTVELISMEPLPREKAISPLYSFTQTRFEDDKGDMAEASQERTLAIIRTSESSGYYVDVFRSKSRLPDEYHDYLYHNLGDQLTIENTDMVLRPSPGRYQANASNPWLQNQQYRHPGWHFFEDVLTSSPYSGDVKAVFSLRELEGSSIFMGLHIPGFDDREYTKVAAPPTFEAPEPYGKLPTPTLVIRKYGESWKRPFVVVYEPFSGGPGNHTVRSVDKLEQDGLYKGLRIVSRTNSGQIIQYVITQSKGEVYSNEDLGIQLEGSFAVITLDGNGQLQDMYMGEGKSLTYREITLKPESPGSSCAYKRY